MAQTKDVKCKDCGTLLLTGDTFTGIIVCPKCKTINWIHHCQQCDNREWHEVVYDQYIDTFFDLDKMYAVGVVVKYQSKD